MIIVMELDFCCLTNGLGNIFEEKLFFIPDYSASSIATRRSLSEKGFFMYPLGFVFTARFKISFSV